MALNRVNKLTDAAYSPTDPVLESDIRAEVDGSIQEIADLLALTTDGSSGMDNIGMTAIPALSSTTNPQEALELIVARGSGVAPPVNSLTEGQMASDMKKQSGGVAPYDSTLTSLGLKANKSQENWIIPTLLNSWVNFEAGTEAAASYFKDDFGIVHFKGLIKSGTITAGTVLFVLPVGYRPPVNSTIGTTSNLSACAIDVLANGNVQITGGANATWLTLYNLSFKAV